MNIYETDPDNFWTGVSKEITEADGCPVGWTRIAPPDLQEGQLARLDGIVWTVWNQRPTKVTPVTEEV